jgi:GGDEF domain-containing protein
MRPAQHAFDPSLSPLRAALAALHLAPSDQVQVDRLVEEMYRQAHVLIFHDPVTGTLNLRAERWFVDPEQIQAVGKVDLYDLKQANRIYGYPAVDAELQRLAALFSAAFPTGSGVYVRRAAGNDEFNLLSTRAGEEDLRTALEQLQRTDTPGSLVEWDFGVGRTSEAAAQALRKSKRLTRPLVIRQTALKNPADIPAYAEQTDHTFGWEEFSQPYQALCAWLERSLPGNPLLTRLIEQVRQLQLAVETLAAQDELTGALNAQAKRWYIQDQALPVLSIGMTDMLNMHAANLRFGDNAVDLDLARFASLLWTAFPRRDGFLVFRSANSGDEFQIYAAACAAATLRRQLESLHLRDRNQGLLAWSYGSGLTEDEAHHDLFYHRLQSDRSTSKESTAMNYLAIFLIARPLGAHYQRLFTLAQGLAFISQGTAVADLHFTLQSMRQVPDVEPIRAWLRSYCAQTRPLQVSLSGIARVNLSNQSGRLWILLEKSAELVQIFTDLQTLAHTQQVAPYPYAAEEWQPHIKAVILPADLPPSAPDPIFNQSGFAFKIERLELTAQVGPDTWISLESFPLRD